MEVLAEEIEDPFGYDDNDLPLDQICQIIEKDIKNIMETRLLPTDWIYDHIFNFSQDEYDEYRDLLAEDQKRTFRYNQLMEEGNDPKVTFCPKYIFIQRYDYVGPFKTEDERINYELR